MAANNDYRPDRGPATMAEAVLEYSVESLSAQLSQTQERVKELEEHASRVVDEYSKTPSPPPAEEIDLCGAIYWLEECLKGNPNDT